MAWVLTGGGIIFLWGLAHLAPTAAVVAGFGALSADNKRILTMEWVAEGLTLAFLGALAAAVALASGEGDPLRRLVLRMAAGMLLVMAAWSLATGARTAILPMRLCPAVKTLAALLLLVGTL